MAYSKLNLETNVILGYGLIIDIDQGITHTYSTLLALVNVSYFMRIYNQIPYKIAKIFISDPINALPAGNG